MEYARIGAKQSKERFDEHQRIKKEANKFRSSEPTKASMGHAMGAQKHRYVQESAEAEWRLTRFKNVKGTLAEYIAQPVGFFSSLPGRGG